MRRYEKGQIVGTVEPPISFTEWLTSELDRAHGLDKRLSKPVTLNSLATVAGAQARMRALEEVQMAWDRSVEGGAGG